MSRNFGRVPTEAFSVLRVLFSLAILLAARIQSQADIIPANRRITWTPGVPGGIPSRATVFADVTRSPYNADKTGSADAAIQIQNALNNCPVGQVVYIPAGTYRLNSQLTIAKGVVLRGAGELRLWRL